MKRLLATLVFLCAAPALAQEPPPPQAQPTPGGREVARAHFQSGEAKFRAGDYRGALKEFLAADAIAPSPILVHNAAVCHERLGEAAEAVRRYREYISRRPDAPNRREIEIRIAALEGAQRPPDVLPGEDEEDGDALSQPQGMKPPAATTPPVRPYDAPFARRVPSRTAPEQPPAPQPQQPAPQAQAPPPGQMQAQAPQYPEPPAPAPTAKKSKPVYKQWWFWVFVGVGTLILIDVASSGGDDNPPAVSRGLEFRF
jgi:tetratricopeptide (TPR) repeat protein